MVFQVAIGTSQNWDPEKAGTEIAQDITTKLKVNPTFALLFTTIHYAKNKGLSKILDKINKSFPNTIIVGGTITGFINNSGAYSKGATLFACYTDECEIKVGLGKNTKGNPKSATNSALKQICLNNTEDEFVFSVISGGKIPFIPFFKQGRVIKSKLMGKLSCMLFPYFGLLKKGVGREDDIFETITTKYPNINFFSVSTMDDEKMEDNYQFYNNQIVSDSIILLKIKSKFKTKLFTTHGLSSMKEAKITKIGKERQIIYEINNKPARIGFLEMMGWPEEYLTEKVYDKVFFYPFSFKKEDFYFPFIPGLFLGDSIATTYKVPLDNIYVMSSSGKMLLNAVESGIAGINPIFGLMSECGLRLQALGKRTFQEKELLDAKFKEIPYLSVYVGGEATYSKSTGLRYGNSTFNLWSFEI